MPPPEEIDDTTEEEIDDPTDIAEATGSGSLFRNKRKIYRAAVVRTLESGTVQNFQIGEEVSYHEHGIGKVIEIKEINTGEKLTQFYCVEFTMEYKHTVLIPVERAHELGLTKAIGETSVAKALEILRGPYIETIETAWKPRLEKIKRLIDKNTPESLAEAIHILVSVQYKYRLSNTNKHLLKSTLEKLALAINSIRKGNIEVVKREIDSILSEKGKDRTTPAPEIS